MLEATTTTTATTTITTTKLHSLHDDDHHHQFPDDGNFHTTMTKRQIKQQPFTKETTLMDIEKRRSSSSIYSMNRHSVATATSVPQLASRTRSLLEIQMMMISEQLNTMNELSYYDDDEKVTYLFYCFDDNDGLINVWDVYDSFQRVTDSTIVVSEELQRIFDSTFSMAAKLDIKGLHRLLLNLTTAFNCTLQELIDLALLGTHKIDEENKNIDNANAAPSPVLPLHHYNPTPDDIREKKDFNDAILNDSESNLLQEIYHLLDLDADGLISMSEITKGLYPIFQDLQIMDIPAVAALLMFDDQSKTNDRHLTFQQFVKLMKGVILSTPEDIQLGDIVISLTLGALNSDVNHDVIEEDENFKKSLRLSCYLGCEAASPDYGDMNPLEYGRLQRLYDLFDVNKDGCIDLAEFVGGLRLFYKSQKDQDMINERHSSIVYRDVAMDFFQRFDTDNDKGLSRKELMFFLKEFAKVMGEAVHDLIDFMILSQKKLCA